MWLNWCCFFSSWSAEGDIRTRAQQSEIRNPQWEDAAARRAILDAGFGTGYKYFTHRVGHGIGMDGHEYPYLVRGNKLLLQPGMTFSDKPGIYIVGEFGVRIEDVIHITDDGALFFRNTTPALQTY